MSIFYNRNKALKGIPVGTIIPWSGSRQDIPRGFLVCSGSSTYNVRDYPILYNTIGNVYGGTQNQTFKLPNINDGSSGAVDMFKGHFYYLNSLTENSYNACHKPEKTVISDDDFWKTVGGTSDGNKGTTSQTNWTSTIDVVGEQRDVDNLIAKYNNFTFVPGEVLDTLYLAGRKLSDVHVPDHTHSAEGDQSSSTSFSYGSLKPKSCNDDNIIKQVFASVFGINLFLRCNLDPTCATVSRAIPGQQAQNNPRDLFGDNDGMKFLYENFSQSVPFSSRLYAGGSFFTSRSTGAVEARGIGLSYDGDGVTGGDMYAHTEVAPRNTPKYYWSNLDSDVKTFNAISEHNHSPIQYTFSSKYVRIINPGLVSDVRRNTVTINNETGRNFGTITANTATPGITMIYLIRAF